jgi:hypothetical protein
MIYEIGNHQHSEGKSDALTGDQICILQSPICNARYCFISEQQGFCTGLGSINSTRVKLGS